MTTSVRTAKADDDLNDWLRIMSNERFRRLPIVDNDNKLLSIMTQGDFVSYTWPELVQQATTMAKATFGESLSLPRILGGILVYTLVLVLAVGLIRYAPYPAGWCGWPYRSGRRTIYRGI